ncbi:unnamed protein product, partial [Heterotrigona itama]
TFVAILATVAFAIATPPQCLNLNGEDIALFSNPDDYTTFYYCDEGIPWLMKCTEGLEYNPELRICDYPRKDADSKHHHSKPPPPPSSSAPGSSNRPPPPPPPPS